MTQELKPNSIHFQTGEPTKCVMRIEADRIWVDPNIEVTEAAALVLQALEANIKRLVLAEREACAKVCRTAQAKGLQSIREAIEAAIRGLK